MLDSKGQGNFTDSLGIVFSDSHIMIAATQNEWVGGKFESSIQVMKKSIAEIWEDECMSDIHSRYFPLLEIWQTDTDSVCINE